MFASAPCLTVPRYGFLLAGISFKLMALCYLGNQVLLTYITKPRHSKSAARFPGIPWPLFPCIFYLEIFRCRCFIPPSNNEVKMHASHGLHFGPLMFVGRLILLLKKSQLSRRVVILTVITEILDPLGHQDLPVRCG